MKRSETWGLASTALYCAASATAGVAHASDAGNHEIDDATDAALRLADQAEAAMGSANAPGTVAGIAAGTAGAGSENAAADTVPVLPLRTDPALQPAADRAQSLAFNAEVGVRYIDLRDGDKAWRNETSLDLRYEKTLATQLDVHASWRSDRFDSITSNAGASYTQSIVREAYASWRPDDLTAVEAGRMNQRVGVGFGYNPTDFFKAGAVDLDVSPDPDSRRTNRLGTVAVRAQRLWNSGSATLFYSPRLASRMEPGNAAASSQLQRTNSIGRWMFVGSQRVTPTFQPQFVAYGEEGLAPQFGLNLSGLFGKAVVAYTEIEAGRRPSVIARTTGSTADTAFHVSSASGFTWTLPTDLSVTLELQTNGAGLRPAQWRELAATNPYAWGSAVGGAVSAQELPTRYGAFAMASWRNFGVRKLDLSVFGQFDQGGGRQEWLELRRHFDHFDAAVQFQAQSGPAWSRYGSMSQRCSVKVLGTFYL